MRSAAARCGTLADGGTVSPAVVAAARCTESARGMRGRQQAARGVMLAGSAAGLRPLDCCRAVWSQTIFTPFWIATDNPTPFGRRQITPRSTRAGNYSLQCRSWLTVE